MHELTAMDNDQDQHAEDAIVPSRYCLGCGYILDGLTDRICPECGHRFDLHDPTTFSDGVARRKSRRVILAMYLLPLALSLAFWATQDTRNWAGFQVRLPLRALLAIGLWQACGPVAIVMHEQRWTDLQSVILCFTLLWTTWLSLVCWTRLRKLPYVVHFVMASMWCFAGCGPTGLLIT